MIRHIVMFKMKPEYEGRTALENALEAKKRAEKLIDLVPTLDKLEVRINDEKADQSNYEFALVCDFADIEALNAYQVHPAHVEFGKFITPMRELRACIDYEV